MIRCADYAAQRIFLYLYFMELHIKNMVCPRCIMAVEQVFTDMGIRPERVQLGVVMFNKELTNKQLSDASDKLEALGFTLLEDARNQLVEKIKSTIIEHIHHQGESSVPFSQVLSSALNRDYSQLSKLFSATEGTTIEHYIILQKIEKVKELLAYNQLTLSEIAYQLGYSSVAHLSAQFKKTTGLTPSRFRTTGTHLRKPIDRVT